MGMKEISLLVEEDKKKGISKEGINIA